MSFNKRYNFRSKKNEDEDDEVEEENAGLIRSVNNHIYFYSPIDADSAIELNTLIRKTQTNILRKAVIEDTISNDKYFGTTNTPITLHINSDGGEVMAAMSIVDTIRSSKVPIVSIIEGNAASAATLISMVCHQRKIHKHALMLIHQISGGFWGKMNEFEDEMHNMKLTMKIVKKLYKEYTKIEDEKLNTILKKDIWWNAKKCVKYGLVDEII